nr:hypothetical protein [Deltaproteobacteria bacterium]
MRALLFALVAVGSAGCVVGSQDPTDNPNDPDPADPDPDDPDDPTPRVCPLGADIADTGDLSALKAQQCNVPGSGGALKFYRMSATLPGSTTEIVQLELYDGKGAFAGGTVQPGTYQITGADASYATCGVCVRAIGGKGTADAKSYFATGGTVVITSVGTGGTAASATITGATFAEVDATTSAAVTSGCTSALARTKIA